MLFLPEEGHILKEAPKRKDQQEQMPNAPSYQTQDMGEKLAHDLEWQSVKGKHAFKMVFVDNEWQANEQINNRYNVLYEPEKRWKMLKVLRIL